jgi:hypothetical protein
MQENSSNVLLSQIDERRDNIADTTRIYLEKLKFDFPEVQYLTLTLKHLYGYSTLRVYLKKSDKAAATNDANLTDPYNPFS